MLYLLFFSFFLIALAGVSTRTEWRHVKLSQNLDYPKLKLRWHQKRVEICLPQRTKWVRVRTMFNRKTKNIHHFQKNVAYIREKVNAKLLDRNLTDIFWFSETIISRTGTELSVFLKVPDNDELKIDLKCEKDPNRQCADMVHRPPSCFYGSNSKRAIKRFTITIKPSNFPQGVRFPAYKFYEELHDCDCHE